MSDMAGEAATVAVERCGSSRDTKLKSETTADYTDKTDFGKK